MTEAGLPFEDLESSTVAVCILSSFNPLVTEKSRPNLGQSSGLLTLGQAVTPIAVLLLNDLFPRAEKYVFKNIVCCL